MATSRKRTRSRPTRRPSPQGARSRPLLRWALLVTAGVLVALVAVIVLLAPGRSGGSRTAAARPGPTRTAAGVPVGYADTQTGAVAAALNYVSVLGGALSVEPDQRRAALDATTDVDASPHVEARLTDRVGAEAATGLQSALGTSAPIVLHVLPLTTEVVGYTRSTATVRVWTLAVLGTARMGQVDAAWSTEQLVLDWRGDWKIKDWTATGGPVPTTYQSTTPLQAFLADLTGMREVGHVSAP
jgi:hypothetical protein